MVEYIAKIDFYNTDLSFYTDEVDDVIKKGYRVQDEKRTVYDIQFHYNVFSNYRFEGEVIEHSHYNLLMIKIKRFFKKWRLKFQNSIK